MLIGKYFHNVDKKGRVFIPSKLKDDLGEDFIIAYALDDKPALFAYSMSEWDKLCERIDEYDPISQLTVDRTFYSDASEVALDSQGRVCIPASLREAAGLLESSEIIIIGARNHVEIWTVENWNAEQSKNPKAELISILKSKREK